MKNSQIMYNLVDGARIKTTATGNKRRVTHNQSKKAGGVAASTAHYGSNLKYASNSNLHQPYENTASTDEAVKAGQSEVIQLDEMSNADEMTGDRAFLFRNSGSTMDPKLRKKAAVSASQQLRGALVIVDASENSMLAGHENQYESSFPGRITEESRRNSYYGVVRSAKKKSTTVQPPLHLSSEKALNHQKKSTNTDLNFNAYTNSQHS